MCTKSSHMDFHVRGLLARISGGLHVIGSDRAFLQANSQVSQVPGARLSGTFVPLLSPLKEAFRSAPFGIF